MQASNRCRRLLASRRSQGIFGSSTAAFAIVRHIPQDAGCAQYHKVSETALEDDQLKIIVDQGG